jgi:hypothetical protein
MPTYINEENNYMQMNRSPRSYSNGNQLDQGLIDRRHARQQASRQQALDMDCKQVLQHIQNCPVCQHVFALKTPPTKQIPSIDSPFLQSPTLFQTTPSSNKIEISISTLILLSVFLMIFFIYIIKTSRN